MVSPVERWTLTPRGFQRVAGVAVIALVLTIVSGATVRLTGSGLGCPDWPACTRTSLVAPAHFHAWVEFANRLINGLVTLASLAALLAAVRLRPWRRDLVWLSAALVGGLVAEVVMGGVVVYSHLNPVTVSVHFLLGLVFLAVSVVLHERSKVPSGGRAPAVDRVVMGLSRLVLVGVAVVVMLGTVVTSTGVHGGDPRAQRFHFSLHRVAQLHGSAVEMLLALTLFTLWQLWRRGAPEAVLRRSQVMVGVMAAQAAVGYTQYLNGDPVALVGVHVAGAAFVVVAALRWQSAMWAPVLSSPVEVAPLGSLVRG